MFETFTRYVYNHKFTIAMMFILLMATLIWAACFLFKRTREHFQSELEPANEPTEPLSELEPANEPTEPLSELEPANEPTEPLSETQSISATVPKKKRTKSRSAKDSKDHVSDIQEVSGGISTI